MVKDKILKKADEVMVEYRIINDCMKALDRVFLQASSVRFSGLALPEVSASFLSHESIRYWLKNSLFRPKGLWPLAELWL
ncbi:MULTISPECIES: hypothetical protein [Candidatus Fukatsuia]|uniref:Uncharacterized protein n=1 Tax=Candidatus Fukatsuia symbiotica TaxID=1878942 RepID=A0A2U8I514_9GAMM|nr:hypothetical protein [Candidatus Fukatsuia symbiotica]AWK13275.1 hypothetical protein CCS41_00240 [Candidatus Fukatsuia symbiotica]